MTTKKPTRLLPGKTLIREHEIGKAGLSTTIVYEFAAVHNDKIKGYLGFEYNGDAPEGYVKGSFMCLFKRKTHALEVIDRTGKVKAVL